MWAFTCQDTAGDPWNALNLCHIVVSEIIITGSIEELRVAEHPPKSGCDCAILFLNKFSTHIEALSNQSTVPQKADSTGGTKARKL